VITPQLGLLCLIDWAHILVLSPVHAEDKVIEISRSTTYDLSTSKESQASKAEVELIGTPTDRAATLRQPDSKLGTVVENHVLTAEGTSVKRRIGMPVR
jgi:hypothetical protein